VKISDRVRVDELVKSFPIQGGDCFKSMAATDKFHLKCLKAYLGSGKRKRIAKQKCVLKPRRAHKKPVKRTNVVRQKKVREAR